MRRASHLVVLLALAACGPDVGADPPSSSSVEDPLHVETTVVEGSLDDLHDRVISRSCAGQAGLCHNGQFEPNLSTPALAFAGLVDAPSLERPGSVRVVPGDPGASLLVDKLRDRDVLSQMPLGAHPLEEKDLAAIESWIARGARRFEDVENGPRPNRAPAEPEVGVFDASGAPLATGSVLVPGATIVFRMSTRDFETGDDAIPLARFLLFTTQGIAVLAPGAPAGEELYLPAAYTPDGAPEQGGEVLGRSASFVVPETLDFLAWTGEPLVGVPVAGAAFSLQAQYADAVDGAPGFSTYRNLGDAFEIAGASTP